MFCGFLTLLYNGLVIPTFAADVSYVSYFIVAMFLYGLFRVSFAASRIGTELKEVELTKFSEVVDVTGYLVMLGLIGTAIGVLVSLHGAEVGSSAADIKTFTTTVLGGTKTAFHTTIVGGITWLWHKINCRMVYTELMLR